MATTIIFNACIITMNERMELIKNGSIRIEGNQIKEIRKDKIESPDAEYFDAEGMIVMPGFINTHTHVPMTMLRGYADDLPLHTWLNEHIFPGRSTHGDPGERGHRFPLCFYRDDQIGNHVLQRYVFL